MNMQHRIQNWIKICFEPKRFILLVVCKYSVVFGFLSSSFLLEQYCVFWGMYEETIKIFVLIQFELIFYYPIRFFFVLFDELTRIRGKFPDWINDSHHNTLVLIQAEYLHTTNKINIFGKKPHIFSGLGLNYL